MSFEVCVKVWQKDFLRSQCICIMQSQEPTGVETLTGPLRHHNWPGLDQSEAELEAARTNQRPRMGPLPSRLLLVKLSFLKHSHTPRDKIKQKKKTFSRCKNNRLMERNYATCICKFGLALTHFLRLRMRRVLFFSFRWACKANLIFCSIHQGSLC